MTFIERGPIEHGFSAAYHDHLLPQLQAMEIERKARMVALMQMCGGLVLGCLLLIGIFWLWLGPSDLFGGLALFLLVVGIVAPFVLWRHMSEKWSRSLASIIMPVICDHLGTLRYTAVAGYAFPVRAMAELGVVPDFGTLDLNHWIRGSYRNCNFELVQAELVKKSVQGAGQGGRQTTCFNGLLLHVSVPQPAPGPILIVKDRGRLGRGLGRLWSSVDGDDMQPVAFDHPAFEAAFDVLAGQPERVRAYVSRVTLDAILEIARAEHPHVGQLMVSAGFEGQSFYLAIRREEAFLHMGALSRSLEDCEALVHQAFAEIERIHMLIDQLHGQQHA